ncbi:MAG: DUF1566 domain-containing protein [Planctomycetes bacterium]|nr:DUF1566 domain-containing protein [Planctomycetota bacterium]
MADKIKPDELEIEKIKLERLKVWVSVMKVLISVGIGTFGVAYINHTLQNKKLEGQMRTEEMNNLGKFLQHALNKDVDERMRFADYFAKLTISDKVRDRWKEYYQGLRDLKVEKETLIEKFGTATTEQKKVINRKLDKLRPQLESIPKEDDFVNFEKAQKLYGLGKNWKPTSYTENDFDLQHDDQVVYDKTTKLMWERSGSDAITFREAENYIDELKRTKFAGYSDWRLPTLGEAMTLLEKDKKNGNLYIDPKFDSEQIWIWTSDMYRASRAWVVYFNFGGCDFYGLGFSHHYVRAVR